MGAKTWMLVIADGDARAALEGQPALDRDATARWRNGSSRESRSSRSAKAI